MSSSTNLSIAQIIETAQKDHTSLHLIKPPNPIWPLNQNPKSPIHISILDSSFNPPTKAHQAIASSSFPSPPSSVSVQTTSPGRYTARLLLFSVRNVDKKLKKNDSTIEQRLEMMRLLAEDMSDQEDVGGGGVAVGLINEPTFVGKSRIIHRFMKDRLSHLLKSTSNIEEVSIPKITLTFLIGTDTLIRFFDPRYYPPGEMNSSLNSYFEDPPTGDGSYLVSARRGIRETDRGIEEEVLRRPEVREWAERGKVRLLGDGNEGWEEISSTKVREVVKSLGGEGKTEKVEKLRTKLDGLSLPSIADYIQRENLYRD